MLPSSQHFGGRGHVNVSGWGLGQVFESIVHMGLHKPNNKLVNAQLEQFWCTDKPWAHTNSQDSPRPRLGGSHHLPFIVFSMINHKGYIQMSFCPKIDPLGTLKGHNFNTHQYQFKSQNLLNVECWDRVGTVLFLQKTNPITT